MSGPQESTAIIRDVDFSGQLSTLTVDGWARAAGDPANREPAGVAANAMVRLTVAARRECLAANPEQAAPAIAGAARKLIRRRMKPWYPRH